jgi:lipopolysaccharide export system protein LptA
MRIFFKALACTVFFLTVAAQALKSDSAQPIRVRSKSVEANEKTGVSIYRGNVVMVQGTLKLEADRVEVTVRDGRTELVRAWGKPVRIQTRSDQGQELRAHAERAEYRGNEQRIDFYGSVELQRDADVFTGAVVHYALGAETFVAESDGDGQVFAVLQPAAPSKVQ